MSAMGPTCSKTENYVSNMPRSYWYFLRTGANETEKEEKPQNPPNNQEQSFRREEFQEKVINPNFSIAALNEKTEISADKQNLDQKIKSMITRNDTYVQSGPRMRKMATCNVCGKEGPYISMPNHVEANHITGVSHACEICGAISRSSHGLKQHQINHKHNVLVAGP